MWDECNLVDYQVPFKVPKIVCSLGEKIPWMDCVEDTLTQSTCKMTCEPRSAVSCVPQTQEKCITGKIQNVLDFRRGAPGRGKQINQAIATKFCFIFFKNVDTV